MFLATDLLTDDERVEAFAFTPEATALSVNWNIALNVIRDGALEFIDTLMGPNYAVEALGALADGCAVMVRAAGLVSESRAAELYSSRARLRNWLARAEDLPADSETAARLHLSLVEMPLHQAAVYVDAALNHFANAIVRLAYELNFPPDELSKVGLGRVLTATAANEWLAWPKVHRQLRQVPPSALLPQFVVAAEFLNCTENKDVAAVVQYRHGLVHRELPAGLDGPYVNRASRNISGRAGVDLIRRKTALTVPSMDSLRASLNASFTSIRAFEDTILNLLPRFARAVGGFAIQIDGVSVAITASVIAGRIVTVPRVVLAPSGQPLSIEATGTLRTDLIPRERRDPGPFLSA